MGYVMPMFCVHLF